MAVVRQLMEMQLGAQIPRSTHERSDSPRGSLQFGDPAILHQAQKHNHDEQNGTRH
jgi:hypothetical protein